MITIDSLPLPGMPGVLGLSRCPGTRPGNPLRRHAQLEEELRSIAEWGALGVLTLNEASELRWLGLEGLGPAVERAGMQWWHCPIGDFQAPGQAFEQAWRQSEPEVTYILGSGGRILVHCLAGLGRTGTVAGRLLMEQGLSAAAAIARVRQARPGAIQSDAQRRYLELQVWSEAGRR
ncbi:phosphatase domain-containing putative toxin [Natronospira bacteriovora]|uniref:Dual specificity protein phosphatase family protein n=1 Tax=Natronospira bacteriovora TaxID=3069753 RepID=A0ABU0W6Z2_9GAMM|nr:dual specificity protein phosphatase family protein [Natronospira sp. AB-CW4]MDQ2069235.1 dual specificity protein phosphatase family protein [Natronospira sp. AB-CW4]